MDLREAIKYMIENRHGRVLVDGCYGSPQYLWLDRDTWAFKGQRDDGTIETAAGWWHVLTEEHVTFEPHESDHDDDDDSEVEEGELTEVERAVRDASKAV